MAPFQVTTKAFRLAGFVASVGLVFALTIGPAMVLTFGQDLPTFSSVEEYRPKLISRVYSVDGRLIGEFGTEKRRIISYERIPKRLIQAFIATEDKNFFDHGGIDWLGIVRAVVFKVIGKSERIGGTSTITQQLAKGLLIDQDGFDAGTERSIRRKVREGLLARRLESTLTKEEILWIYLNHVYLGHGAYGVQAAAENYFRKDVGELDVAEMSLIAGLPQAPSRFSPFVNPKQARARQQIVLNRMVNNAFITAAERDAALARSVEQTAHARDDRFRDTAPYFTEHVRRYIYDTYGEKALYTGGLEIHTTLNLERQAHAEEALVNGLREVDKRQGYRGPIARGVLDEKKQAALLEHIDKVWLKDGEPVKGEDYLALVTAVDGKKQLAEIRIGTSVTGVLPLAGLRWARTPNPNQYWEANLVDNIKNVLKPGDVILVMLSDRDELRSVAMNAAGLDSIPERPKDGTVSPDPNVPLPIWARPLFVLDQVPEVQGALIAMNPHTGYVEAMIGGYAFEQSEFNRAFQACRQPGSTFKPIVYSAAIAREGYHPGTMILDTPITVRDTEIGKSWKPQNFELEYKGEVTCREAVMNSMNVPALKTMEKVGIKEVLKFARRLGIKTELKEELGTAIGSSCVNLWELTNVYTTWARMGLRPEPVFLKRILDRDGNMLEEHASPNDPWQNHEERLDSLYRSLLEPPVRSLDAVDAFLAHYLLTQVAQHGTAARASRLKKPVAGKTGTTNDNFDTWFAGYAPSLVTTVWVGYDTNEKPLAQREQGGRTSLPIWLEFMTKSLAGKDEPEWLPPEGVCFARVDSKTGARVFDVTPGSFAAPFRCGEEPRSVAVSGGLSVEDAIKSGGM
jgi:penicillin-binding protein 1A